MSYQVSSTDQQILFAASMLTTYGGLIIFSAGIIGNTVNILAFSCLKVYRSLSTSAFLTTASLSGQVWLGFTLFRSAVTNLLGYNPASRNTLFCRATLFIPRVTVQISLTCLCLSAIDRYLMTSRSARRRAWITLTRARLAIVASVVVWCAYGVPNAVYAVNYPFINLCIPTSDFGNTVTYLNLVFAVLLPIVILCLFGFLTWKNLSSARLSSMNVQVTKMILLDVVVVTISNLPLAIFLIYAAVQTSGRWFTPVESLLLYVAQIISSIQSCGSFYFYLMFSPAFRQNIIMMLTCGKIMRRAEVRTISATAPMGGGSTMVEAAK